MSALNSVIHRLLVLLSLLVVTACTPSIFSKDGKPEFTSQTPINNVVVDFDARTSIRKINSVRKKHLLGSLSIDPRLMQAAQKHADLMGRTGKFGHEFGPSTKFKRRIFAVGFENTAGENLGVGYTSIEAAIDGWLKSPGHRKILLKRNYKLGGIAYATNTSGKSPRLNHFWVFIAGEE